MQNAYEASKTELGEYNPIEKIHLKHSVHALDIIYQSLLNFATILSISLN